MRVQGRKGGRTVAMVVLGVIGAALMLVLAPTAASAEADCDISRFTGPDGVDVTGYLQCSSPSVSTTEVRPGETIVFQGGGFMSNSSIDIVLVQGSGSSDEQAAADPASSPFSAVQAQAGSSAAISLGTVQADASGNFTAEVVLPDVAPGSYVLEARGVDPNGNPLTVALPITVLGDSAAAPSAAAPAQTSGALPYTGTTAGRWVIIGLGMLALGVAAVWGARRNRSATT